MPSGIEIVSKIGKFSRFSIPHNRCFKIPVVLLAYFCKHVKGSRVVIDNLLHKGSKAIASIKLIGTERIVAVSCAKAVIVITATLPLGKVGHLIGKRHIFELKRYVIVTRGSSESKARAACK